MGHRVRRGIGFLRGVRGVEVGEASLFPEEGEAVGPTKEYLNKKVFGAHTIDGSGLEGRMGKDEMNGESEKREVGLS